FYANSEGSVENVNIRISGKFYRRWFSEPKFEGYIEIDNIEFTKGTRVNLIFFGSKGESGWLVYHVISRGVYGSLSSVSESVAWVKQRNNFEQVVFQLEIPKGENGGTY